ncbi:MAG: hypothetical protein ACOYNS_02000 [Bacteroidota bacterium]
MNITKDIIADLIPLYLSGDCSEDTKRAVTAYISENPEFAEQIRLIASTDLPNDPANPLNASDALKTLKRTRSVLQRQKYLMAFAIFFTLLPFSCLYTNGRIYWLFIEAPVSALIYESIGVIFWIVYLISRRTLNK